MDMLEKKENTQIHKSIEEREYHSDNKVAQIERNSGKSFSHVKVHYNSSKPRSLHAAAYTYGSDIYIAPGQNHLLVHELGHSLQQEFGLVQPTSYINGIAINQSDKLERNADKIVYENIPLYNAQPSSPVIQRKLDVAVSLKVPEERDFGADEIFVDSIKLSGRDDTGLKNSKGKKTQGDHIIADALIKKHQKVMIRDCSIGQALYFYHNLASQLIYENMYVSTSINNLLPSFTNTSDKNEILKKNELMEKQQSLNESITRAERFQGNSMEFINGDTRYDMKDWRKNLVAMIQIYNDMYAHSYFATHGTGTGGRGEKEGMNYIRNVLANTDEPVVEYFASKLYDQNSLKRAIEDLQLPESDALKDMIDIKFKSMFLQMRNYHQGKTGALNDFYIPYGEMYNGLLKDFVNNSANEFILFDEFSAVKMIYKNMGNIKQGLKKFSTKKDYFNIKIIEAIIINADSIVEQSKEILLHPSSIFHELISNIMSYIIELLNALNPVWCTLNEIEGLREGKKNSKELEKKLAAVGAIIQEPAIGVQAIEASRDTMDYQLNIKDLKKVFLKSPIGLNELTQRQEEIAKAAEEVNRLKGGCDVLCAGLEDRFKELKILDLINKKNRKAEIEGTP